MPSRPPLRVGLNLLYLRPGVVGGTETYARGLLGGLAQTASEHAFVVFVNRSAAEWALPDGFERVVCGVGPRQGSRYLYEQLRLPRQLRRHRVDVVHSLAYVAPVRARCASVVTVHDLNFRAPSHRMRGVRRVALSRFVSAAVRACDAVIVVSRFIRDELSAAMPHSGGKLHVVHEAPVERSGVTTVRTNDAAPDAPYFIAFSSVSPNKNLERLVEAYRAARTAGVRQRLVLVGHRPPQQIGDSDGIVWTGFVADPDLERLLRGADALLFPSLYEGFGLPVLESMHAGVPVACSRSASLPEIAGDAAYYFDAEDVASIASAIERLAEDRGLRADLAARGLRRASEFTWRRAAEETVAVYHAAIHAHSRRTANA